MGKRSDRPCVLIDLAIPRDIDGGENLPDHISTLDLQSIQRFVEEQQKIREQSIPKAEEIIDQRLSEFNYWYNNVLHEPIYNGHSNTIESIRQEEMGRIIEKLPPALQKELQTSSRRLVDRVIQVASRAQDKKME